MKSKLIRAVTNQKISAAFEMQFSHEEPTLSHPVALSIYSGAPLMSE